MKEIGERGIINSMCLKRIRTVFFCLFMVSCSSFFNVVQKDGESLNGLHRNFIQANKTTFTILTPYIIKSVESIKTSQSDDFYVVSSTVDDGGSAIKISKTTDKLFQGLRISFLDDTNTLREIQVNFYSKLINILEINDEQEIIYDKANDVAPPLFITTSFQLGQFTVCEDDKIVFKCEFLKDLYFFSLSAEFGSYSIGEVSCNEPYFRLLIC